MTGAAACALAVAALIGLTACDVGGDTSTQILARQAAIDPPQLWLVQLLDGKARPAPAVFVCADTSLRDSFVRARAEVNGRPCEDTTSPLLKAREWVLSCKAQGRAFTVSASTLGDLDRDFRLNFALTPLFNKAEVGTVRQSRRFRLVGACPAGWRIGDQAKPGRRPHKSRA